MIGEVSALGAAAAWGLSGVFLVQINRKVNVLTMGAVRCLITSLFFFALLPANGGWSALAVLEGGIVAALVASVVLIIVMGDSLFFVAARRISMVRAMPLSMVMPLFTVVLAAIVLGETISILAAVGTLLILAGAYLLSAGPRFAAVRVAEKADALGIAMTLGAAFCWALGTVVLTPASQNISPVVVNAVRQPFAALFLLAVMPKKPTIGQLRSLHTRDWGTLIGGSLAGGGVGAFLFLVALQHTGASIAAVLTATTPVFSTPFSVLLLGEKVRSWDAIGTVLIMAGVWLVIMG